MNFVQMKFVLKKKKKTSFFSLPSPAHISPSPLFFSSRPNKPIPPAHHPTSFLSLTARWGPPVGTSSYLQPVPLPPAPLSPVPSPSAARPFRSAPVLARLPFPSFTPHHQDPVALYHSPVTPTDGQSAKAVVPTDHQLV